MTAIEWTDVTWNPTTGCDRVSPGCGSCYALTMAGRLKAMGQAKYQADGDPRTSGPGFKLTVHPDSLDAPLHWRKPRRVFVNSMSDLFHPDVPDGFIADVFGVMAVAVAQRRHTFQILTKRPQRMAEIVGGRRYYARQSYKSPSNGAPLDYRTFREAVASSGHRWAIDRVCAGGLSDAIHYGHLWPLPNVWLGTSIESDRYAFRADHLRATPAAVRFLSLEPLLGPLPSLDLTGIDWVIVGGESGPGARPMHPDWARDIRDRCVAAGIPFFFKQWGAWVPYEEDAQPPFHLSQHGDLVDGHHLPADLSEHRRTGGWLWPGDVNEGPDGQLHLDVTIYRQVGKKTAGRELDGRTWDEMPS